MQRMEVSCAVRHTYIYIYMSLGAKGLKYVANRITPTIPCETDQIIEVKWGCSRLRHCTIEGKAVFKVFVGTVRTINDRQAENVSWELNCILNCVRKLFRTENTITKLQCLAAWLYRDYHRGMSHTFGTTNTVLPSVGGRNIHYTQFTFPCIPQERVV